MAHVSNTAIKKPECRNIGSTIICYHLDSPEFEPNMLADSLTLAFQLQVH